MGSSLGSIQGVDIEEISPNDISDAEKEASLTSNLKPIGFYLSLQVDPSVERKFGLILVMYFEVRSILLQSGLFRAAIPRSIVSLSVSE